MAVFLSTFWQHIAYRNFKKVWNVVFACVCQFSRTNIWSENCVKKFLIYVNFWFNINICDIWIAQNKLSINFVNWIEYWICFQPFSLILHHLQRNYCGSAWVPTLIHRCRVVINCFSFECWCLHPSNIDNCVFQLSFRNSLLQCMRYFIIVMKNNLKY